MRQGRIALLGVLLAGVLSGGVAGYAAGSHRSQVTVTTGSFYAGDHQATGTIDGWSYGLTDGVTWVDSANAWHESGWPDCLAPAGSTHTVRFAWAPVDVMGMSWRQVVWVSCRQ